MKVVVKGSKLQKVASSTGLEHRIGFWATVLEVDSKENSVRVLADTKQEYYGIPVISKEWVCDREDYVTGSRNLPPVGSRVFVLVPSGTIASAFILCSGFTRGDSATHGLWGTDSDADEKARSEEKISQGGWDVAENYDSGQIYIESKDKKVSLTVDLDNESILLSAWETTLEITSEGIKINPKKLEITSQGDIVFDAGSNNFTVKAAKFEVNPSAAGASLEVI